ncbi:MAG: hypothetical protein ACWGPN_03140 [Gammaproteobacteria bacterium]|jgi:hypothetical protein
MRNLFVAFLLVAMATMTAHGQDTESDTQTEQTPSTETGSRSEDTPAPARVEETQTESRRARPQSFEPSEDISEDLSVSFPVDI